jgi:hypothetical protein
MPTTSKHILNLAYNNSPSRSQTETILMVSRAASLFARQHGQRFRCSLAEDVLNSLKRTEDRVKRSKELIARSDSLIARASLSR